MKKRIVSFLLALVMAVSLLPVSAFAADSTYAVTKDTTVTQGLTLTIKSNIPNAGLQYTLASVDEEMGMVGFDD